MPNPPTTLKSTADNSSDYVKYWPHGRPAITKLSDNLILEIPPQFQKFWFEQDDVVKAPAAIDQIPLAPVVGFAFFLPDFSGFTPSNYKNDFDPARVDVVSLELADPRQAEPDAPGFFPPNMLKRMFNAGMKNDYQEMYGLRCYHPIGQFQNKLTCYGRADEVIGEDIILDVYVPPFDRLTTFPNIQAVYFTKRYGGLQVIWRTHASNLPRWHDIDAQIWKFIESWNIAASANPKKSKHQ